MAIWLLFFGALTVLVRAGLTILTGGVLRPADVADALLAAAADTAAAALAFWAVGAAFLFGRNGDLLAFDTNLVLTQANEVAGTEFFHAAVAIVGGAVVTSAVAGRTRSHVGPVAAAVLGGIVFPVIGHLVWSGRLAGMNVLDFGGALSVHLPAAIFAAVAVAAVGSRADADPGPSSAERASVVAIGTVLAAAGWLPYLMGSVYAHKNGFNSMSSNAEAGLALATTAMNGLLAGAAGLVGGLAYGRSRHGRADLFAAYTGLLGGLVAITPACVAVGNVGAVMIGGVAGALVPAAAGLMRRARLDDPVGLVAVHGVGAVWGTLAAAMFAAGLAGGQSWIRHFQLLAVQSLAVAVSVVISAAAAAATFGVLRLIGPLRATDAVGRRP